MLFCTIVYLFFVLIFKTTAGAFTPPLSTVSSSPRISDARGSALHVVDPSVTSTVMMIGATMASASAGVAFQFPRNQKLQKEKDEAVAALKQSEQDYKDTVSNLEEKLFQMDSEFEDETAESRRTFESRVATEVEKVRKQAKEELGYTLDAKLQQERTRFEEEAAEAQRKFDARIATEIEQTRIAAKEKYEEDLEAKLLEEQSRLLQEKLAYIGTTNGEKDTELVELRLNQSQLKIQNKQLKETVTKKEQEVEQLRESTRKKVFPWPF